MTTADPVDGWCEDADREVQVRSVMVVDDHRTVADLLGLALDDAPGLRCAGVAHDAVTALRVAGSSRPDVVVCDLNLGGGISSGLDLARVLVGLGSVVVLLTGDPGDLRLRQVEDAGVSGLLAKDGDLSALLQVLRRVDRTGLEIDPRLLRNLARPPAPVAVALSPRERQVLEMMGRGQGVSAISRDLGIGAGTCRGYVKALLHKLDAHSQLELVARARSMGLLGES